MMIMLYASYNKAKITKKQNLKVSYFSTPFSEIDCSKTKIKL